MGNWYTKYFVRLCCDAEVSRNRIYAKFGHLFCFRMSDSIVSVNCNSHMGDELKIIAIAREKHHTISHRIVEDDLGHLANPSKPEYQYDLKCAPILGVYKNNEQFSFYWLLGWPLKLKLYLFLVSKDIWSLPPSWKLTEKIVKLTSFVFANNFI